MYKVLNLIFAVFLLMFFISVFKFYSSNRNFQIKDYNRINIEQIINDKISNLQILANDTNNVVEFNNSISDEIDIDKPRSFWNLLKTK